jgi:hypothetical protein
VTAIPLTPGAVGVVELALVAGLAQAGGARANVVAAVLLFRLLTYVLPIISGAFTYIYWRRNRSWRNSAPPLSDSAVANAKSRGTSALMRLGADLESDLGPTGSTLGCDPERGVRIEVAGRSDRGSGPY